MLLAPEWWLLAPEWWLLVPIGGAMVAAGAKQFWANSSRRCALGRVACESAGCETAATVGSKPGAAGNQMLISVNGLKKILFFYGFHCNAMKFRLNC